MTWTNLAIQRKRIKELKEILGVEPKPYALKDHRQFVVYVEQLDEIQSRLLREAGYDITTMIKISKWIRLTLSCSFDLEKQDFLTQDLAKRTGRRSYYGLSDALKLQRILILEKDVEDLTKEKSSAVRTIQIVSRRLKEIMGKQNVNK